MAIFSNQATLTYQGTSTNSNVVYGEILEVLTVSKTAIEGSYTPGGIVTYVLSLRNGGNSVISNLQITDDLGAYQQGDATRYPLTYVNDSAALFQDGTRQGAPAVTADQPLTFTGISVPAGGDTILVYQAEANAFADPRTGGTIQNTATVTGVPLSQAVTATAELGAATAPLLSISKAVTPSQVVDNDRITYTFRIQNTGNQSLSANDAAVVSDTFDPILTALSVTLNGTPLTQGTQYRYDETTGEFSTVEGQIVVPAATYTRDPVTGSYTVTPGITTLIVTGTV